MESHPSILHLSFQIADCAEYPRHENLSAYKRCSDFCTTQSIRSVLSEYGEAIQPTLYYCFHKKHEVQGALREMARQHAKLYQHIL